MIQQTMYYAVFKKLLPSPLKLGLLLSQLSKFCQNHISYKLTSIIIVIALSDLRRFGICDQKCRVNLRYWR